MKWRAPEKGIGDYLAAWTERRHDKRFIKRASMAEWHRRYAWLPKAIPQCEYEGVVVPRHFVWLEYYDFRRKHGENQRRSYTMTQPFESVHEATRHKALTEGWL